MWKGLTYLTLLVGYISGLGEFVARCSENQQRVLDPIVFPGQYGRGHMHSFFGANGVTENSTLHDIMYSTTSCNTLHDHSAYWVPTLYKNGQSIIAEDVTFYYHTFRNFNQVKPMPVGLIMVTKWGQNHKFSCQGSGPSGTNIVDCGNSKLEVFINFPECWDGLNLDSPDHLSHMAYSVGNNCPSTHPVILPRLQFKIRYPTNGGAGTVLSSGTGQTAHADFINAWVPEAMELRVNLCSKLDNKCDEILPGDQNINSEFVKPVFNFPLLSQTYVRNGVYQNTNFESNNPLVVKHSYTPGFSRESLLKFGVDQLSPNYKCVLTVHNILVKPYTRTYQILVGSSYDDWDQELITWNNKPVFFSSVGPIVIVNSTESIDVTQLVYQSSSDLITFHLYGSHLNYYTDKLEFSGISSLICRP